MVLQEITNQKTIKITQNPLKNLIYEKINKKTMKKILGFIAIILGLIGCLVAWMKENKRNCYKEAGLIDNEEVINDDFPPVNE